MTEYKEAVRKAKFGHRDWIAYGPKGDERIYEPLTGAALKRALLASGTKGRFTVIAANTGIHFSHGWRMGTGMLRNARHLGIPA